MELLKLIKELTPSELEKATQLLKTLKEANSDLNQDLFFIKSKEEKQPLKHNLEIFKNLPSNIEEKYFEKHHYNNQAFFDTISNLCSLLNIATELTRWLSISNISNAADNIPLLVKKINHIIKTIEDIHHTDNTEQLDPTDTEQFKPLIEITKPNHTISFKALALYLILIKQRLIHLFSRVTLDEITVTSVSIFPQSMVVTRTTTSYLEDAPYTTSVLIDDFGTTKDNSFKHDLIWYITTEFIPSVNAHISALTFQWADIWKPDEDEDEED